MKYYKSIVLVNKLLRYSSNSIGRYSVWSPVYFIQTSNQSNKLLCSKEARNTILKVDKKSCRNESSKKTEDMFEPLVYEDMSSLGRSGEELSGPLDKMKVRSLLNKFHADPAIRATACEHGINETIFQHSMKSFRKYCLETEPLPTDLHILLHDLTLDALECHAHHLYAFFVKHAETIFPHLKCLEDLHKISDLTDPLSWFPEARAIKRKIIFHAGPTNSGKTHHAMERFLAADSGRYHGPLKMLAVEVFQKSNAREKPCDLLTGEEKQYAVNEDIPANHSSSTVEMAAVNKPCDVAIIDEIQMINNSTRGWAWTRALLGIPAKEVHVCGEASAIGLVQQIAAAAGDEFELKEYKRLTKLTVEKNAIGSLNNIRPGDCVVCFNLRDIHTAAKTVEAAGHEVSIIYGDLPPGTKNAQSKKFNDPAHKCDVMVATDAIGMGLNLSIRRIVFYSLLKTSQNIEGEKELGTISVSQALQIAGRAGRYGTQYEEGFVTTLKHADHQKMTSLLSRKPPFIEQAGIRPTSDQIELFAYHLRNYDMAQLVDIFVRVSTIDLSNYFMCHMNDFKEAADVIKDVSLPLRTRYVFCLSPINLKKNFPRFMLREFAQHFANNTPVDYEWMQRQLKWPFAVPKNQEELTTMEETHEVFTLYLWLSYRYPDMFPHREILRGVQTELDTIILEGVTNLIQLLSKEAIKSAEYHQRLKILQSKNELANIKISVKKTRQMIQDGSFPDPKLAIRKDKNIYADLKNMKITPKKR